jgi:lysophospholipase L1-like esterase
LTRNPMVQLVIVSFAGTFAVLLLGIVHSLLGDLASWWFRIPLTVVTLVLTGTLLVEFVYALNGHRWVLAVVTLAECFLAVGIIRVRPIALGTTLVGVALPIVVVSTVMRGLFWSDVESIGGDSVEPGHESVAPIELPAGTRYVSLGDSFSAGEGLVPYMPGTGDAQMSDHKRVGGGNRCHRSRDAYPNVLTFAHRVDRTIRACSGARVRDMEGRQRTGGTTVAPQLQPGVLGSDVSLVTITIGGNDVGFSYVIGHCARTTRCTHKTFDDSFDDGKKSGLSLGAWAPKKLAEVQTELTDLYREIRREAPNARVVVLSYPYLFPTGWTADVQAQDCLGLLMFETSKLLDLQDQFNDVMYRAATSAGVELVWTGGIFSGHEACGGITPRWMKFPHMDHGLDPGTFHPTRNGQTILARTVECYLYLRPSVRDAYPKSRAMGDCARYDKRPRRKAVK